MNNIQEITTFIEDEAIDIAFISESHDRENKRLEDNIHLPNHKVISNLHQRSEKGGRPAIIANARKYIIENLTNTSINIPWGVEITWALLTLRDTSKESMIKRIVLGSIYVKPSSRKKTATINHISEVYNTLNTKYGRGTFWIIAGDTNNLKLGHILSLNKNLKSVVKTPTRLNLKNPSKSTTLDNIISDLHKWYQKPKCLAPISSDKESGKPSDHLTVVWEPINVINNTPLRQTRQITVRPMTESGLKLFSVWIQNKQWTDLEEAQSVDIKVELFNKEIMRQIDICLPTKIIKFSSVDEPWCNNKVKNLKRLKCREKKILLR